MNKILKMSLNYEGDRLATCSCKGTIIRVFSLPKGEKLCTKLLWIVILVLMIPVL